MNTEMLFGYKADMEWCISKCDSCQEGNKQNGKSFGLLQEVQKPSKPWLMIKMDCVTGLPTAGNLSYTSLLLVVYRLTKKVNFIPIHKDMDTKCVAFVWWSHMMNEAGLPLAIMSDTDRQFTAEFCKSLLKIMGCSLKLSTAHHPETDGLAESSIQNLEGIIRRHCAFGLTYNESGGFKNDWLTLLPGSEYSYNSIIHSTTAEKPF